jgi:histidinol dehydrogenase
MVNSEWFFVTKRVKHYSPRTIHHAPLTLMPARLNSFSPDFDQQFAAFLRIRDTEALDVSATVTPILRHVHAEGDAALIRYTEEFDKLTLTPHALRFTAAEIAEAVARCPANVMSSLKLAAQRIRSYHQAQMPQDWAETDRIGMTLGWRWGAVDAAGLYVPGGRASYPSSVLMNAIPAKVAGVERLVMVVPTPHGEINPAVLAAADIAGVTEIYRIGGAQAIAALAYGTESIAPVDVIVGPGNAYVAEAKRQVFGLVGIDMIAGPSEILILADADNNPDWIAADLLSQSEHGTDSQSILITDDSVFAELVAVSVEEMLRTLPREPIARISWEKYGAIITVPNLQSAVPIINRLAPEHLELAIREPESMLPQIRHAGAIFLGRYTPEALGDYLAGPSHVLPTSRTARFSSGLGVMTFLKRTSLIGAGQQTLANLGEAAALLADCEGLEAHARSIRLRLA